ncbi:hypothetical protein OG357_24505 [Streptomyces sp. NBC_01255]|uniref:hypothetical protein n=1 Tax=Streptomyces sp. NBC_01255 TaxID=2903798 RepID=UPI002E313BD9|nr:hypothetical protein [Streptomyces sp. NBC_01255]
MRAEFGDGLRAYDRSLSEMKERMVTEARGWAAAEDDLRRTTYRPCQIEGRAEGAASWVTSTAGWSMDDIGSVSSAKGRQRWRKVADGVYVAVRPDIGGTQVVMPCTIPGTAAGQGSELPLQVSVNDEDRKGSGTVSTEQLLKSLAESTRELLGCEEKVAVPDDLLP